MSGFIKVFDKRHKEHYLNVSHIVKFYPTQGTISNTVIVFSSTESLEVVTTVEEILDMINLSKG